MTEKCPHCGASVLFTDNFCPRCRKSRIDGSPAPEVQPEPAPAAQISQPRLSPKAKRLLWTGLLASIAIALFWQAHQLRNRPRQILEFGPNHEAIVLSGERLLGLLAGNTNLDPRNTVFKDPGLEALRQQVARNKSASASLTVVGITIALIAALMAIYQLQSPKDSAPVVHPGQPQQAQDKP